MAPAVARRVPFARAVPAARLWEVLTRQFLHKPSVAQAQAALARVFGGNFRPPFLNVLLCVIYGPSPLALPERTRLLAQRLVDVLQAAPGTLSGLTSATRSPGFRVVARALHVLARRELVTRHTGADGVKVYTYAGPPGPVNVLNLKYVPYATNLVVAAIRAWRVAFPGEIPQNRDIAVQLARMTERHVSINHIGFVISSLFVCRRQPSGRVRHGRVYPVYERREQLLIVQYVRDHQYDPIDRLLGVSAGRVIAYLQSIGCPDVKRAWVTMRQLVVDGMLSKAHGGYTTAGLQPLPATGPVTAARLHELTHHLVEQHAQWGPESRSSGMLRKVLVQSHFAPAGFGPHKVVGLRAHEQMLIPLAERPVMPDRNADMRRTALKNYLRNLAPGQVLTDTAARLAISAPKPLCRELNELCAEGWLIKCGIYYVTGSMSVGQAMAAHGLRVRPATLKSERASLTELTRQLERLEPTQRRTMEALITLAKIREYSANVLRLQPASPSVTHVIARLAAMGLRMEDSPYTTSATAVQASVIPPEPGAAAAAAAAASDARLPSRRPGRATVLAFMAELDSVGARRIAAGGAVGPGVFGAAAPQFSTLSDEVQRLYADDERAYDREVAMLGAQHRDIARTLAAAGFCRAPNTGGGRSNCWIISLLQHAFDDYRSSHLREAEAIRRQLVESGATRDGLGMTASSAEALLALRLVNRHPRTLAPLRVHTFADSAGYLLTAVTELPDEHGRPPVDVAVYDESGHFEAVVCRAATART